MNPFLKVALELTKLILEHKSRNADQDRRDKPKKKRKKRKSNRNR